MSDLFGNHIVGFPTRWLILLNMDVWTLMACYFKNVPMSILLYFLPHLLNSVFSRIFQLVDLRDGTGVPPLVIAVKHGHLETCRLLLEKGANVDACENKTKRTSVYYCVKNKLPDILELLLK